MKRLVVAAALAAAAAVPAAPASAFVCPIGTQPATLPTGQTYCKPIVYCDPVACPFPEINCPTDIPVWSYYCRQIFGG